MLLSTYWSLLSLYSSVSLSELSEYVTSPWPPAKRPRAASRPAELPYPVYFTNLSTVKANEVNYDKDYTYDTTKLAAQYPLIRDV